ncbi:cation/H(+) antiporter 15-like [Rhodamnia argentea]|uniref:Cation/H(+) antiporter 15-like n=1 Tax=Rhodamnia argentea TaxID=178133 RepID=A0A8B8QFK3_9MYRT|nr:cation/H(+) antiporter 15-like [Rhodamnia argentea]
MVLENSFFNYKIIVNGERNEVKVCPPANLTNLDWSQDPLANTLPILFSQILLMIVLGGLISILLKPLHQPRFVAEIIGGILIGPTLLANNFDFHNMFLDFSSAPTMEAFTNLGVVYYMFLVGLEMNLAPILRIQRKSISIALAGILVPLAIGFGSYFVIAPKAESTDKKWLRQKGAFVWGIALTATNLPDVTRILSEVKLLRTETGRTALSCAYVSDIGTWLLLVTMLTISHDDILPIAIATGVFVLLCLYVGRPALLWLIDQTMDGEEYTEYQVQFVLCGVMLWGFLTDAIGVYSIFGAFMFGFIMPSGQLATLITERLDRVTSWIMVPMYCLLNGVRTNIPHMVPQGRTAVHVVVFVCLAWAAKFLSTVFISVSYNMERREAVTLGVLMNTKGLLAIIVINIGRDLLLLDIESSAVMVVALLVMTITVPPIIRHSYRFEKPLLVHKRRTIESNGPDSPFQVLAGIYSTQGMRGIVNLLQLSHATRQSPIHVVAVHLVELTEHTSAAMLVVHDAYKPNSHRPGEEHAKPETDQIIEAFENYARESDNTVSVEALTALSPYATLHVDVCSIAEDKRASIIILPFHIQGKNNDEPENRSSSIKDVNENVLAGAPCSVALLVNRGLGMSNHRQRALLMFFVCGPDDREALAYAWRMSCQPEVHLTVVRFFEGDGAVDPTPLDDPKDSEGVFTFFEEHVKQRAIDEDYINEFKSKTMDSQSVTYTEEVVNDMNETLTAIRQAMERESYELCIVGRGKQSTSPLLASLSELSEYPELGALGDAIVTSNFALNSSVLVVQQYTNNSLGLEGGSSRFLANARHWKVKNWRRKSAS